MTKKIVHPSLLLLFLDPGSEIRDPGWVKIRIRDKHPGSATLQLNINYLLRERYMSFQCVIWYKQLQKKKNRKKICHLRTGNTWEDERGTGWISMCVSIPHTLVQR
jgi:hypothetical protein